MEFTIAVFTMMEEKNLHYKFTANVRTTVCVETLKNYQTFVTVNPIYQILGFVTEELLKVFDDFVIFEEYFDEILKN